MGEQVTTSAEAHDSIDLRGRSGIIISTADAEKMNQSELAKRVVMRNKEFTIIHTTGTDNAYDFMIIEPRKKAEKKVRTLLLKKLISIFKMINIGTFLKTE